MTLLVRTPSPQTTESLLGYVLRISEANGYDTPWHLLAHAGFSQREMRTAGFPISKLAAVLGRHDQELNPIAYCATTESGERYFKILCHSLGVSLKEGPLRLHKPAFCPSCIQECGYLDAFWDLSLAVACPCHRCRLIDACPACGKALRWFRPRLLTCGCGANLQGIVLEPASAGLAEIMAVMKAKLHGISLLDLPNTAGFPLQELETLSLRSFVGVTSGLGNHNLFSKGEPEKRNRYLTVESAVDVLSDWPSRYHQFLHRFGAIVTGGNPLGIGLRKQFERFYSAMFKANSYSADSAFLRKEFVRFGLTEWGQATVDKKLLRDGDFAMGSRFLSNSMIAREAGVRPITLRRWAEKGLIPRKEVRVGNQVRYILDAEGLALVKQTPGRVMQTKEAAARLGLPVSVLVSLRESGYFPFENMTRHKAGFHETDVENFRLRMLQRSVSITGAVLSDEPRMSLNYVLQEVRFWSKIGKAEFVAAYLDGDIQSVGKTGDSWKNILFRKADIDAYVGAIRMAASNDALSQQETARIIGCDLQAIPGLISSGNLIGCPGRNRIRVECQSIENFLDRYIVLAVLAKHIDTTVARLLRLCTVGGIKVLCIARRQGSAIPFIQRENQEALLKQAQLNPPRTQAAQARSQGCGTNLESPRESGIPVSCLSPTQHYRRP